jgi:diguanylate cyclase (GGDEF)-like protein
MAFDANVVIVLSAIIPVILGVMMTIYWRTRKTYRGFKLWVAACFSIGLGFIFFWLNHSIPVFFSLFAGNFLTLLGLSFIFDGIQQFFGRRAFDPWNYLLLGVYLISQSYLAYVHPDINARIALVSGVAAVIEFRIGLALLQKKSPELRLTCTSIAIISFISSVLSILRGVYALVQTRSIDLQSDETLAALSFGVICLSIVWTFFLIFLNSARLEMELRKAQKDVLDIAAADHQKVVQLSLLQEASQFLVESLEEGEIMQRTVGVVVKKFGYAEAAISLLVAGDSLEVTAIDGTEDIGYVPGYRQKIGEGIIGHAAEERYSYVSGDIERDPYYFTIGKRSGSAAGIPLLNEGQLMGVLYVESSARNAFTGVDIQTLETLVSYTVTAIQKARLYMRVEVQLRAITTLQSVSQAILSSLELPQICQSVVALLKDSFKYTYVSIYLLKCQVLCLEAQVGYPEEMVINEIPASSGICGRCVQAKQVQFIPDVARDPSFLRAAYGIESEICVPLLKEGEVLGVINVEAAPGHQLTENDVIVLTALAGPVVIAVENARLHAEVKEMALTDGLTALFNRRAFDQALDNEIERAARYNYSLALIMIDLDWFKQFNDEWGHPAGDERLKAVADLLRSDLRNPDFPARYGGDEFALILPYTNKEGAMVVAERLRSGAEKIASSNIDHGAAVSGCTFSLGVAVYPDDARTASDLLHAADRAELTAKKWGKNRVCSAGNRQLP